MALNLVMIQGNLTADPVLKKTKDGKDVTDFTVAVNETKDHTEFVPVVAWKGTAINICNYLSKGSEVIIHGKYATQKWVDKDGKNRYTTKVYCTQFHFTRGSRDSSNNRQTPSDYQDFNSGDYDSGYGEPNF